MAPEGGQLSGGDGQTVVENIREPPGPVTNCSILSGKGTTFQQLCQV